VRSRKSLRKTTIVAIPMMMAMIKIKIRTRIKTSNLPVGRSGLVPGEPANHAIIQAAY
jgi:hypothetical protein